MRNGFHEALVAAISEVETASANVTVTAPNVEMDALKAENKKLKYRVAHLLRTIDEMETATK